MGLGGHRRELPWECGAVGVQVWPCVCWWGGRWGVRERSPVRWCAGGPCALACEAVYGPPVPVGMSVWVCMVEHESLPWVVHWEWAPVRFQGCVEGYLCPGPKHGGTCVSPRVQVGAAISGFCGQLWMVHLGLCAHVQLRGCGILVLVALQCPVGAGVCVCVCQGVCWPQCSGLSVEEVSLGDLGLGALYRSQLVRPCALPLSRAAQGARAHLCSRAASCPRWEGLCMFMNGGVEGAKV